MIQITRISYHIYDENYKKRNPESTLLATCSVVLNDSFMVHDIRVLDGVNGTYIGLPDRVSRGNISKSPGIAYSKSKKSTNDVFHPVNRDTHIEFSQTIIDGYFKCKEEGFNHYHPE